MRMPSCAHTIIDIDAMFKNNTPYLNFWVHCAKEGLLEYDEDTNEWYPALGMVMFIPISKIESRNQLFRDFCDKLGIYWEDFQDN